MLIKWYEPVSTVLSNVHRIIVNGFTSFEILLQGSAFSSLPYRYFDTNNIGIHGTKSGSKTLGTQRRSPQEAHSTCSKSKST
ncbi:MAG: hypothetical protein R3A43_07565 [Bacteroidia bacterium]